VRRVAPLAVVVLTLIGFATVTSGAGAAAARSHGRVAVVNANQSNNWSGYNQGTLEQGTTLFSQVSGDWTVPTATQHTAGAAESSSVWIGIGGGCVDAGCATTDSTLIQAGTEEDVSATGQATYSAWYELIPAPSLTVSMTVRPGDLIHADIHEVVSGSNVWSITMNNRTNGQSFSTTVPYSSTKGSAEWILETPLGIGTGGVGLSNMPDLSTTHFNNARRNNANANLKASEEMQLVSGSTIVADPSAPDTDANGFNDCTYATSCATPAP
jgi:hypothetical protein